MKKKKIKLLIFASIFLAALTGSLFLVWQKDRNFEIVSNNLTASQGQEESISTDSRPKSPISGLPCEDAKRRPIAVMLSGDAITRPLSGIGQSDLVFNMQVTEGGITRMMAVYVCESPAQIGSVRSARHDYIPLALGFDAIYAHWGGSHFSLDKLKTGIIDNIDALPNIFGTFYRQSGIEAPHNGFTSMPRLLNGVQKLGYRLESEFVGYLHKSDEEINSHGQEKKNLSIDYPHPFNVSYQYNPETNSYLRFRGGTKEMDKNTGKQVEAKNIVIMRAVSRPLEGQYNDVQVEGEGKAEFYLNGQAAEGSWKKDPKDQKSRLIFLDSQGKEIKFVAGQIWIEIVDPLTSITFE